jgi:hypothetical protein
MDESIINADEACDFTRALSDETMRIGNMSVTHMRERAQFYDQLSDNLWEEHSSAVRQALENEEVVGENEQAMWGRGWFDEDSDNEYTINL